MSMNRKLKRAKQKSERRSPASKLLNNINFDQLEAGLGTSEKVGEREPYSSGRIKERVGDSRPSEEELLQKFSKTKLENDFVAMTKFTELYSEFEELFCTDTQAVDIKLMNETWDIDKIIHYFNEVPNTGLDTMNNMCDLASYAKNKGYIKLQERILEAVKSFKPRLIGVYTRFSRNPKNISEVILAIRAVQNRYLTGAPFLAVQNKMPIDTIEARTKALLDYNEQMEAYNSNPMGALSNQMINAQKDPKGFDKKIKIIAANIINDDSIAGFMNITNGVKKEMKRQATKLCEEFNKIEDQLEDLSSLLNEDYSFSYEKAKLAYTKSDQNYGSTEDYLRDLKKSVDKLYSVVKSMLELYIADTINKETTVKEIYEDYGFEDITDSIEETYLSLLESIKFITGHFIVFSQRKGYNWTEETDIRKANTKFLKEVEKFGLDRKIERPKHKKNEILNKMEKERAPVNHEQQGEALFDSFMRSLFNL